MMDADNLIGKDVAEIREALRRIETRFDALERLFALTTRDERSGSSGRPSITPVVAPIPFPEKSNQRRDLVAATIRWKATDVRNDRRVRTPDRSTEIVFFGYMLGPISEVNPAIPSTISDVIYDDVLDIYNSDTSASVSYWYRPGGYRDETAVFGFYNHIANLWSWVAVEFWHKLDNPRAMFSTVYGMDGAVLASSFGQILVTFDIGTSNYKTQSLCEDSNYEYGLGFSFNPFYT
jgi:hypothetical protein